MIIKGINIPESPDTWVHYKGNSFRVWNGCLFRKQYGPQFFDGYQINIARLISPRFNSIAEEWLK